MKKEVNLKVRVDKTQRDDIRDFCKTHGIGQSEFIRTLIKKRDLNSIKIFTKDERENFEKVNLSLLQIGTNINQIAHFLNLEHLKSFGNFRSIEDIVTIDKLKESQLNSLKNDLQILGKNIEQLSTLLTKSYERKA